MEEYPPLKSLEEAPLHCAILRGDDYWACSFPERPPTENTLHDWRCYACVRHAEASLATAGDRTVEWYPNAYQHLGVAIHVKLSWLIERSKYFLGML